jgi:hypothetical protein
MKRTWIRLILLLVVLSIQSCCWSNCPIPEKSAVEWHTGHGDSSG